MKTYLRKTREMNLKLSPMEERGESQKLTKEIK
jgi:hypothetical protein